MAVNRRDADGYFTCTEMGANICCSHVFFFVFPQKRENQILLAGFVRGLFVHGVPRCNLKIVFILLERFSFVKKKIPAPLYWNRNE
jgi:hypothetical protein